MAYLLAAGFLAVLMLAVALVVNGAIWLGLRRGWRPLACVSLGGAVLLAVLAGGLVAAGIGTGQNLWQTWRQEFNSSLTASIDLYRRLGWEEAELQRTVRLIRFVFLDAIFGWIAVATAGLSFLSYLIQRQIAPGLPGAKIALRPFNAWVIPDVLIWFLLAALGLLLVGSRVPGWYSLTAWNLLVALGNMYFLGGVAIAAFFMERRKVPRVVQMLLLLAVGLMPMLMVVVALIGVFDTWWDWRHLKKPRKS